MLLLLLSRISRVWLSATPQTGSPPGSPILGILQARTLKWVAISFSDAWKWNMKVKSLSCVRLLATPWTAAYEAPPSMGFARQEYWTGVPLPTSKRSQSYSFSSSHVWMWELDHKESSVLKKWCFWTVVLEKTLESPLDCKEIKKVNPKGDQPWIFMEYAEAETPILWPSDGKSWLIGKNPDAGEDWRQKEKETPEDAMVEWHHQLNRHEFEQAPGVGNGLGGLACCSPWGCKESDKTEKLNWNEEYILEKFKKIFHVKLNLEFQKQSARPWHFLSIPQVYFLYWLHSLFDSLRVVAKLLPGNWGLSDP